MGCCFCDCACVCVKALPSPWRKAWAAPTWVLPLLEAEKALMVLLLVVEGTLLLETVRLFRFPRMRDMVATRSGFPSAKASIPSPMVADTEEEERL